MIPKTRGPAIVATNASPKLAFLPTMIFAAMKTGIDIMIHTMTRPTSIDRILTTDGMWIVSTVGFINRRRAVRIALTSCI